MTDLVGNEMEKDGMYTFLLVSPRAEEINDFTAALTAQTDITLKQVDSGGEMLQVIGEKSPHLVILDQEIGEMDSLDLVNKLLQIDAMINSTMITSMDAESWHEKSEGLGMMPPVPDPPTEKDALALLQNFRGMPGLS
jgi:response regulator RpfG family c-di-GMP phosphodiesterase